MMAWLKKIGGGLIALLAGLGAVFLYQRATRKSDEALDREMDALDSKSMRSMRKASKHWERAQAHEEAAKRKRQQARDKVKQLEERGNAKMANVLSRYADTRDRDRV